MGKEWAGHQEIICGKYLPTSTRLRPPLLVVVFYFSIISVCEARFRLLAFSLAFDIAYRLASEARGRSHLQQQSSTWGTALEQGDTDINAP